MSLRQSLNVASLLVQVPCRGCGATINVHPQANSATAFLCAACLKGPPITFSDSTVVDLSQFTCAKCKREWWATPPGVCEVCNPPPKEEQPVSVKLHEVKWMHLGTTGQYAAVKKDIAHVCRDVTRAGCIDEICIHDIVATFKKHGFLVVPETGGAQ